MKEKNEIARFKVETPELRIVERYRIVKGIHDCDTIDESYWLESWLPNTKIWSLTYRYHRWSTIDRLINSVEYKTLVHLL